MSAVRFAFGDVGNVNFHDGDIDGTDAVGQGDGSVGVASWIHHHGIVLSISLLQFVDEAALMVRLVVGNLVLRKRFDEFWQVFFEGHRAIDFGFALAQQVEVGTVEDENFHLETFCKDSVFGRINGFFVRKLDLYHNILYLCPQSRMP